MTLKFPYDIWTGDTQTRADGKEPCLLWEAEPDAGQEYFRKNTELLDIKRRLQTVKTHSHTHRHLVNDIEAICVCYYLEKMQHYEVFFIVQVMKWL